MTNPRDITYTAYNHYDRGNAKVKATIPFNPVFLQALTTLASQLQAEQTNKSYFGKGNIIESWGLTDKRFVKIYNQLNKAKDKDNNYGRRQEHSIEREFE